MAHTRPATVFVDELDPRGSQYFFDQFERLWIAGIPSNLYVVDRISMKAGCFREVSHSPIQRCPCHSYLCICHRHAIVLLSHVSESQVT